MVEGVLRLHSRNRNCESSGRIHQGGSGSPEFSLASARVPHVHTCPVESQYHKNSLRTRRSTQWKSEDYHGHRNFHQHSCVDTKAFLRPLGALKNLGQQEVGQGTATTLAFRQSYGEESGVEVPVRRTILSTSPRLTRTHSTCERPLLVLPCAHFGVNNELRMLPIHG
jgi:hypothetical protein